MKDFLLNLKAGVTLILLLAFCGYAIIYMTINTIDNVNNTYNLAVQKGYIK